MYFFIFAGPQDAFPTRRRNSIKLLPPYSEFLKKRCLMQTLTGQFKVEDIRQEQVKTKYSRKCEACLE